MSIQDQTKNKMAAAIEHHKDELKGIRTGRANPMMLDHVMVEVYGTLMRIKDIASISAPEPRQLLTTPFDPTNKGFISKAIEKANLGYMPIIDGNVVRIKIPQMDESVRKEMIKLCHKRGEEAKVAIRNIRRDANEAVRQNKDFSEDEKKKFEKQIQDLTDKFCKEVDDITSKKEKEVSTI
jgi:ribosome recycling factor